MAVQPLSPKELAAWLADAGRTPPVLLDVREVWEYDICHIAHSRLIPMGQVPQRHAEVDRQQPVAVICHHGVRSLQVAYFLERTGFAAVYNLTGGVDAWQREVDPTMKSY